MEHIRLRIPKKSDIDGGRVVPMSTGVRAFMGEKKVMDVEAPPLVRSTADHPVGVTESTGGEVGAD